ncbi:PREDICTED: uncharacterized protein LOC104826287 isoform X2 [Tarenaya hassleriana]|uniref:uncharacterized protein LOC104826287 isoform X2 n=1 Tax=Tarenaya hassleriana TaxID=28532 RepID=UPI00053C8495|nr:PREDICTED: uncharacterized protein LOC104826287 isoform X2 [Tarenaya hassleriana]
MRIARFALRSLDDVVSHRSCRPIVARALSANAAQNPGPFESTDDFERRIFGGNAGNDDKTNAFFQHLGRAEKEVRDWRGGRFGGSGFSGGGSNNDDIGDGFDPLSDGIDGKLKKAAAFFEFDQDERPQDGYSFRPNAPSWGDTYTRRDLDLRKAGTPRGRPGLFEVTSEEVLKKADFRNVRFLARFLTEAGIIIKRKQTGISAKAQRKIAREIKTARAFGLMPFTTMGTKAFVFGKTMEAKDEDFSYEMMEDDEDDMDSV